MPRHSESTLAAIKQAVDIVALIRESLTLHSAGSKFKALCPFHNDHNPSLEINPERQSFKCWSCGAGGDVFDFVKDFFRLEFPEALRMLADRAGIALENPSDGKASRGPSKADLMGVNEWAERLFVEALGRAPEVLAYVARRGIDGECVDRFRLGYAPEARDWLATRARRDGFATELLVEAGLAVHPEQAPKSIRERFRGRLIFPIHDLRGRTIGFGGRILPDIEKEWADRGKRVAKYLNSSESPLFQKRKVLYGADLARTAAREQGWVAVVEGYTDVIAAHQVGLANVVGTLGTALGDDHVESLRRLADRVVLIFDGDEAGQTAADRSLELFLTHEVDVRVLTLPSDLDPCEFLLEQGAEAFRGLVDRAVDPLAFAIQRASSRFNLDSPEDSRRAAEWVLSIFARVPKSTRIGLDIKIARALDTLSQRMHVPVETLERGLREYRRAATGRKPAAAGTGIAGQEGEAASVPTAPIRLADLAPFDRQLVEIVLNQPDVVGRLVARVPVASIRDAPLRAILQACYDLHAEGETPTFERVSLRLDDPAVRSLAAGLLLPIDPAPLPERSRPAPWEERLAGVLARIAQRDWEDRLRDLTEALRETDPAADPESYQALRREMYRHHSMRPDTKKTRAS